MNVSSRSPIELYCPACQRTYDPRQRLFGCPLANNGQEHILQKQLTGTFDAPQAKRDIIRRWKYGTSDSFAIFRNQTVVGHMLGSKRYRQLLDVLQGRIRKTEGKSFRITPLVQARELADAIAFTGPLWIKDETENITGSHKGRHLMGSLLYLEALRELDNEKARQVLAIYSCGNAALAASAVARAGGYELHAFVPETVATVVAQMLAERGAVVEKIPRAATDTGDPCYLAFRHAIDEKKWVPFSCSGNDNWSNIEGGETLGSEMAMQLEDQGAQVSNLVIQVGGGALARSVSQSWETVVRLGISHCQPRIYACQAEGNYPLVRSYYLTLKEIARHNDLAFDWRYDRTGDPIKELARMRLFADTRHNQVAALAAFTQQHFRNDAVQIPLKQMVSAPDHFMWAWDGNLPQSNAHGILDDLTYDWYYLLRSILKSGGQAVVVEEEKIQTAHRLAREHTALKVSCTGSAGLGGLLKLLDSQTISPNEAVGLLFTGVDR